MRRNDLLQAFGLVWKVGRGWVIFSAAVTAVFGLLPLATLWVVKELVNGVADLMLHGSSPWPVFTLLLIQFLLTVFTSAIGIIRELMQRSIELKLEHDLQKMISEKTTSVPLAYFDIPEFYHHLNRIKSNLGSRFLAPVRQTFSILQSLITLITLLGYMFTVHWSLAALSLLAAIPMLLVQIKYGNQRFWLLYRQTPTAREAGYVTALLTDRQSAKEIRLLGLRSFLLGRWSEKFRQNARELYGLMRKQKAGELGLEALTAFTYGAAAVIIIWLAQLSALRIGDFVAVGQAVQGAQNAFNQIAHNVARIYEERLYIQDFFRFLTFEEPELARQKPENVQAFPTGLAAGIQFENVSFSYIRSDRSVLKNVSFQLRPGEKIAIVGENGSGKTTLVKCLMGLYPVTAGRILFDDIDIRQIDERELHRNITVIFQDFMQYAFTVRDNIAFGDISRYEDQARLEMAAGKSGIESLVSRFPQGYDTYLGRYLADGEDLSGGQWQRIALARALYRDAEVIVLDEPTAALDPETEMEVFRRFDVLTQEKTAIYISHRMAAARMADRILVMKDGELIEQGSHEELMKLGGEYQRMYAMQAQWYA